MSRQHAHIWNHPGHHLVDPYTWPWSPNGHTPGHEWHTPIPFIQCQLAVPFWDTAIYGQGHLCGQSSRSHLTLKIQKVKVMVMVKPIGHIWGLELNLYIYFLFHGNGTIWLRYSKFDIWPWKFKVKIMAKVKPDGHIWGLEFSQYVCFLFHGNQTIFG